MPAEKPRLFFGQGDGGTIFGASPASADQGIAYRFSARTVRVAPAGPGGECAFRKLVLVASHTMACTLRVTPFVDGVQLESQDVTLPAADAIQRRIVSRRELGLSVPYYDPDTFEEALRTAPRGAWIEVQVESVGFLGEGDLSLDGVVVEREILRTDSLVAPAGPGVSAT